jgi:hypothetical protein
VARRQPGRERPRELAWTADGERITLPARYSFTFIKSGDAWVIVDHHSSAMPPPLK